MSHKIWIEGCTQQEADAIADMIKALPGVTVREVREFHQATPEEVELARETYADYDCDLEIDDEAGTSETDTGVWVQAWVWLSNEEPGMEDDEESECTSS